MIAAPGPERRRRRPAVSCSLCRRRKIRCNRESPCSNCIKSKAEPCVYDGEAPALRRPQDLGFSRTVELDLCKATKDGQMLPPNAVTSLPSYASRSIPSSSKGSSSRASHASVSEVDSMKSRIRQLEEQLAKVTEPTRPPPPPSQSSRIETSTSEIAGTFHINHESRMGNDSQCVSRSVVIHKSRLFGSSHWAQGASMFRDVFEMIEPFIRGKPSKVSSGVKRCKELARIIKAQRTPQWPTPPTSELPPKGIADELVDCYLHTIETTFRVLHVPTFKTEYDALWVSDARPSTAFTVQLKLVLALGAITYDDRFSMRPSAIRWVYEAHTWLSDPDFKPQLNIQSLQSRVLLTLAREIINVGGDSTWISAGALLRTALHMGLHRDPSALPPRSTLAAEMRRRLWNTILELCLQSSISSGGAPLLSLSDFDCAAPGNFDDEQLMTEDPVPKADDEYTQTSIARALRRTYPHRLAIAKFLNDLGSYGTYEGTLRLDAELRESYRAVCRTLRGYSSRGPSPSKFEACVLDFMIHYYVCCLHMPFFEKSLVEAAYAFSRKVIIESALKMWYAIYPSSTITNSALSEDTASDKGNITRFVECGFGFFRTGSMVATMFVSLELKTQLQDEDSLGPSPYRVDLFSLLCDAKERSWNMIECGETNVKGYLLACLVTAQIEGLMKGVKPSGLPEYLLRAAEAAEERCLAFMEEKAGQGQAGGNTEVLDELSANSAPFMGDWEFIKPAMSSNTEYSQTLQHITDAKLEELSNKRQIFLKRKADALAAAEAGDSPLDKLRILSNGVKTCFDVRVRDDGRVADLIHNDRRLITELSNLDRFLKQAQYDPSISQDTLERWRRSLLRVLDVQTLKYEYATLFAQLTMEWLSVKQNPKAEASKSDGFEKVASSQKLESRKEWEDLVFTPVDIEADTVKNFLGDLFTTPANQSTLSEETAADNAKAVAKALDILRAKVTNFETHLRSSSRFDSYTLNWVIPGLISSDLPTEKQRAVLRDFLKDRTVLTELADVLNMRLAALHSWSWGPEVTVEQRRQLNGSYQIHMHEDLIQAIFLQYIGVKWSVFFKEVFQNFRRTKNVWTSPRSTVPTIDKKRRAFFLGQQNDKPNLQIVRESIHRSAYFVSQLMTSEAQVRKQEEGEQEAQAVVASATVRAKRAVAPAARFLKAASDSEEEDESDEDMGFGLFDGDEPSDHYDPDQSYHAPFADSIMRPANQMQAKQNLLLLLGADITINKRLYGEITCFRTQYESLYPSLPHPTILAVLSFFGVSENWLIFFERFLTAPLKFADEPDAEPRLRRRGTPGAHILSEVFGETALFCLDFLINKETNGESLWRVNDDLWFWSRGKETSIAAWNVIKKFNKTMGLSLSTEKSGSANITSDADSASTIESLPAGRIRWGMLYLNSLSGRFEIDQKMVDIHIAELKHQLKDKEASIFGWIQAWNSYASTFFTYNFGTPANCFGQAHVDMMLQTHERIQREIFSSDSTSPNAKGDQSVVTYLRETIQSRFGNTSIPDGYFFLPIDLGGLELSSPFISLVGLRDAVTASPDSLMDDFFKKERDSYDGLRRRYAAKDKDHVIAQHKGFRPDDVNTFMPFDEFTRYRELLNYGFYGHLVNVYENLLRCPSQQLIEHDPTCSLNVSFEQLKDQFNLSGITGDWHSMTPYWKWVAQLHGPEIVGLFGGFNVVDPGLLPIGLISQFRSGKVSWREE
ncbi:hypothetical protein BDW74DRAFT_188880 [Aspergillus multicolor]|uniref:uncharacterized protein n=1 Tax=Aspergillus multicolor TaxID=41759 RepID=UPI003CCC9FED